jgi:uncharacterized iron-regulated protein
LVRLLAPLALVAAGVVGGCGQPSVTEPIYPVDDVRTEGVLCDISDVVIVPAINDFNDATLALRDAVRDLNRDRTATSLESARRFWRAARQPWEFSEAFIFGPAKNQQLDPAIDSWPLDRITMEDLLASDEPITADLLASQEGTAKGFHAIEYFLFGENGNRSVESITEREYQYMMVATEGVVDAARRLRDAWQPHGSADTASYAWQLCNAGSPSSLYRERRNGFAEVINRLVTLSSELTGLKMAQPYFNRNQDLEEARFSGNSKAEFVANVEGIRAAYLCEYRKGNTVTTGRGIGWVVAQIDPALDARVRAQLDEAVRMVKGITPSFGEAVVVNPASVASAINAVSVLEGLLDKEVRSVVTG